MPMLLEAGQVKFMRFFKKKRKKGKKTWKKKYTKVYKELTGKKEPATGQGRRQVMWALPEVSSQGMHFGPQAGQVIATDPCTSILSPYDTNRYSLNPVTSPTSPAKDV